MNLSSKAILMGLFSVVAVFMFLTPAYGASDCIEEKPNVDIDPSVLSVSPGETGAYTVKVVNKDSDNCPLKKYTLNGTSAAGFGISFSPSSLIVRPGSSDSVLMKISVPSAASINIFRIDVTAFGENVTAGNVTLKKTEAVQISVRQKIEDCEARVTSLRFKESNANSFETSFSKDDDVSVFVDVSLDGNIDSRVLMELFANGNTIDSETDFFTKGSSEVFQFEKKILTKNYNDRVNVKVVVTPDCNPVKKDDESRIIDIKLGKDDVEIEVDVGTPSNSIIGGKLISRVFVENKGEESALVNIDARLCKVGGNCVDMSCEDSIFIVNDDLKEVLCTIIARESGNYKIEATVTFEDDRDVEVSNIFIVRSSTDSQISPIDSRVSLPIADKAQPDVRGGFEEITYICSNNIRQAVVRTPGGSQVSDVDFCPFGCAGGSCIVMASPVRERDLVDQSKISNVSEDAEIPEEDLKFSPPSSRSSMGFSNFFKWLSSLFSLNTK